MEADEKVLTAQYTSDISDGSSFSKTRKSKRTIIDSIILNAEAGMIFLCLNVFILNNMLNMNQFKFKILIDCFNTMKIKN